jgi:uncharacterized DUF497 family protein
MDKLKFTWDIQKNIMNKAKHGISFEEGQTVFFDDYARLIPDPDHSESEERFILLGLSSRLRMLVVCHCYREDGKTIRIISARKANKFEQKQYRGFRYER